MDQRANEYHKDRQKFSLIVYMLTLFWIILGIAQWMLVNLIEDVAAAFRKAEWISAIFFLLSIVLILVFIFFEGTRFAKFVNWMVSFLVVECVIIGLFTFTVKSPWQDLLLWSCICAVMLYIFILVGMVLPHDLTLDIVILFVIAFVCLVVSVFLVMMRILTKISHTFFMYQSLITIIILMFVMYHAQTINGGRFAEMRRNDYLLATLILFYDYIVIFLLTFYEQIDLQIASSRLVTTTTTTTTTTATTATTATLLREAKNFENYHHANASSATTNMGLI